MKVRTEVEGREATPSAGSIDSQSVKSAGQAAGKRVRRGQEDHRPHALRLSIRSLFLALALTISAIADSMAAPAGWAAQRQRFPRLKVIWTKQVSQP